MPALAASWRRRLDRGLAALLVSLMTAMVLAVLWQVATRYVFGSPSSWTEELARYLMVWIGLCGGAYAVGQRIHLAVDLVRLRGTSGRVQEVFVQVVVAAFAVLVLCIGGALLVELSLDLGQTSPALSEALGVDVRIGWVYAAIPVSGLLTVFYAACAVLDPTGRSADAESGGDAGEDAP